MEHPPLYVALPHSYTSRFPFILPLQAATEHWAKRMGNKNINMKTGRGVSISTVGVDIGDWTFEKKSGVGGGGGGHGPVTFRTWDFGGQGGDSVSLLRLEFRLALQSIRSKFKLGNHL